MVIQEALLPEISELNDEAPDKKQGDQTQFSLKNICRKRKMDLILPIIFAITPTGGSRYRVIDSSNMQEIFSSVSKFLSCNEEKTVDKRLKK